MAVLKLTLESPQERLEQIEEVLEPYAQAISIFEIPNTPMWRVEGYCYNESGVANLESEIRSNLALHANENLVFEILPEEDWLAKSYEGFKPITAGRFFVHGSHYKDEIPADKIPLLVNAATAFGSGEHQTTFGCLEALTEISTSHRPQKILDMGTGSGILAFAASKLWHKPVIGVDIDKESVRVARENAKINGLDTQIRFIAGKGFKGKDLVAEKYDLIMANILANPLCDMAFDLMNHTSDNAYIILSGILNSQANQVKMTYVKQNAHMVKHFKFGEWSTLLMRIVKS